MYLILIEFQGSWFLVEAEFLRSEDLYLHLAFINWRKTESIFFTFL